jgi:hypothetical protein
MRLQSLEGALPSAVAVWQESIFLPSNRYMCVARDNRVTVKKIVSEP